jgi:hypothetical protein
MTPNLFRSISCCRPSRRRSSKKRNLVHNRRTGRVDVDVIRYHQGGWASGTVTVDGQTHDVNPDEWFGFRDHSWGVRQAIGEPLVDLIPEQRPPSGGRGGMKWTPAFIRRSDGTYYETALFVIEGAWEYSSAYLNETDGTQLPVRTVKPRISYDARARYVQGGELELTMETGERRVIEVEALGQSGFLPKTAGYGAWAGHKHGAWKGPLHVDGEYIADAGQGRRRRRLRNRGKPDRRSLVRTRSWRRIRSQGVVHMMPKPVEIDVTAKLQPEIRSGLFLNEGKGTHLMMPNDELRPADGLVPARSPTTSAGNA